MEVTPKQNRQYHDTIDKAYTLERKQQKAVMVWYNTEKKEFHCTRYDVQPPNSLRIIMISWHGNKNYRKVVQSR